MSVEVSEAVESLEAFEFDIECSGKAHMEKRPDTYLHGDLSQSAKWYIRSLCGSCDVDVVRPVCDAYVQFCLSRPYNPVICECGKIGFMSDMVLVLGRI